MTVPGGGRLLVVDDNAANIRLLEAILATHGYSVTSAADGEQALAAVAAEPPDLVLLDIQMPVLDGYGVCRALRADEMTAALPVIMITAAGNDEKVAALEAGADDFLPRPFDQAELLARVRSLLRMKTYRDAVVGQAAELASWNRLLEDQVRERVEEVERLNRLRRFLSRGVAEVVLSSGDTSVLEPHRREVAILICDLRGFTAFSVAAEPEEVLGALQEFHRLTGALITKYGGTVGPFTGDGLIVIFNDPVAVPDPAWRAVAMAIELRDAMAQFGAEWERRGHELSVGVGVTYGYATMGVLGFDERSDYMAVGPVVNLASRLCDTAAGGEVLIAQRICSEVADRVVVEPRGLLELRGFPAPQPVFAVVGPRPDVERAGSAGPGAALAGAGAVPGSGVAAAGAGDVPGPVALPPVEFDILGPLQVRAAGADVDVRAARERALLLMLLVERGRVISVDRLADALWDGRAAESSIAALRVLVSRLRKTLATAGLEGLLVTRPTGYLLDVPGESVDALRFERLAAEGRAAVEAGEPQRAAELLRAALALWRGPALADVSAVPFALAEAARLEECRLVALEDCFDAELACGRHRQVLGELDALVGAHPLREKFRAQQMLALHRSGRQPDALAAYQSLRRHLADELGLEPSPELARLHQAILTRAEDLEPAT